MMLPLIGWNCEMSCLRNSLKKRESLLFLGPAGSGKTALLQAMAEEEDFIHLRYSGTLHQLLVDLAAALLPPAQPSFEEQTSVHLKGLLSAALEAEPRAVALDGIDRSSFPTYRFFQRLYFAKAVTLIATARNAIALGSPGTIVLGPKPKIKPSA
jgi:energy-coupling factor transporter ATP-binding protein EcfA2